LKPIECFSVISVLRAECSPPRRDSLSRCEPQSLGWAWRGQIIDDLKGAWWRHRPIARSPNQRRKACEPRPGLR
jgi:hypothetical protein